MTSAARIDKRFTHHPKVVMAGNEAVGAWVRMLAHTIDQLTDGFVSIDFALRITNKRALDKLVSVRLLEVTDGGYRIHDFFHWYPPAAEVVDRRLRERERKALSRRRPTGHLADGDTDTSRTANGPPLDPSSPLTLSPSPAGLPADSVNSLLSETSAETLQSAGLPATSLDAIRVAVDAFPDIAAKAGGVDALSLAMDGAGLLARRPPGDEGMRLCGVAATAACAQIRGELAGGKAIAPNGFANTVCRAFTRLLANPKQLAVMLGESQYAADSKDSPAERARRAKASAEAKAREEAVAAEKKREAEDFARRRAEGKLPMPTFMTPATPEGGGK